jgi:hypothetical protein
MTDYLDHVPLLKKVIVRETSSSIESDLPTVRDGVYYKTVGRAHTLLFHKVNDSLALLTWAKPLNQKAKGFGKKRIVEAYNRKMGRTLVENRRDKVLAFLSGNPEIPGKWSIPVDRSRLHSMIPTSVVESLKYYTSRSAKALNLITPFQIVIHCPVKNKESRLALIEGAQFYAMDTTRRETTEDDQAA